MKITQKFVGLLVAISLSSGLWGMNDAKEDPTVQVLPTALVSLCFTYLEVRDFAKVPRVCSLWNKLVDDEKLWTTIGMRISEVIQIKDEDHTWKEAVRDWVMIPSHVLSMATWEPREIEYAISDDGFVLLQGRLLDNLAKIVVKKMKSRIIDSKDFAALFLAYYVFDMAAARHAARKAAWDAAWDAAWNTTRADWDAAWDAAGNAAWAAGNAAGNAARDAAGNAARDAAGNAARDATWNGARNAARAAGNAAGNAARDAADPILMKTIKILKIKDVITIGRVAYKLSALYILAYISRDEYFADLFEKSFLAAKRQLEEEGFSRSTDEILSIISSATWAKEADPSLGHNPHIIALKAILMGLNPSMREMRHEGGAEENARPRKS